MTTMICLSSRLDDTTPSLIGISPAIQRARQLVTKVAPAWLPVLLVGPTGTGKELVARQLHAQSGRRGPWVDVNCGALPRDMVESLLFGHRRGAFTGALESRTGLIQQADGGTLFLDELASLPAEGQAKLLRVLETGEVLPLGEHKKQPVRFRAVAAVQDDIGRRTQTGAFRQDLFHRVAGIQIALPALSERREDIPLLVNHFAAANDCVVSERAMAVLRSRAWPGNVRELRNCVERAALLADGGRLEPDVFEECGASETESDPQASAELLRLCRVHGADVGAIARCLGVSRATLYRRLRRASISLASLKVSPVR